jgi:tRNA dimethylallyltransferase
MLTCAIIGPTASGKSSAAMALARRDPSIEIVSVDSMQIYRSLNIGTAKPTPAERAEVPHHMIDLLEPEEPCSVGWFARQALATVADIESRGRRALLVGGSPLYLKGIFWGLEDAPPRDEAVRAELQREAAEHGSPALHARLADCDPAAAARIHPNDAHRIVRALEVWRITGRPMPAAQVSFDGAPRVEHAMVGLRRPRQELYDRIDTRADRMMADGLAEEVARLHTRLGPQARHALGYAELVAHQSGECTSDEAVAAIKQNSRRYAKHQLTWFRHFPQVQWLDVGADESADVLAERCCDAFQGGSSV